VASGEIATTVSIIAPIANKLGLGATGLLVEWQNLYVRRTIMVLGMGLKARERRLIWNLDLVVHRFLL
ncbi:MAG: hypothetical protein JSW11_14585, partial [Candidatus Heimdallarchaeota archaeon]